MVTVKTHGKVVRSLVVLYATLCTLCMTALLGFAVRETWKERNRTPYVFPAEADLEQFEGR